MMVIANLPSLKISPMKINLLLKSNLLNNIDMVLSLESLITKNKSNKPAHLPKKIQFAIGQKMESSTQVESNKAMG